MAELMAEGKTACRTPAKGRDGVTNIPTWKFDVLRDAILEVVSDGPLRFAELKDAVRGKLSDVDLTRLGSLGWHVTTVKLELEMRGDLERVPGAKPQEIRLAQGVT